MREGLCSEFFTHAEFQLESAFYAVSTYFIRERFMFGIFKADPIKKLQKDYERISKEAIEAQRRGDIALCAKLSQEADEIGKKMDSLKLDKAN